MPTKSDLVSRALKRIGINSRFSDADPVESQDALQTLEDLMASDNGIGIRLSYVFEDVPVGTTESGIPSWAVRAVVTMLAVEMCPYFDKEPPAALVASTRLARNTILNRTTMVIENTYPSRMPRGQGNFPLRRRQYYPGREVIITEGDYLQDSDDELVGP